MRVAAVSAILAAPATAVIVVPVELQRTADLQLSLERVVRSVINDQLKERCESDPKWFLTGPLEGRPPRGEFVETPENVAPRPKIVEQPFELFAYDEQFIASSAAAPRFPLAFRDALRTESKPVMGPFTTPDGTGAQYAIPTGWVNSPCMFMLGRLRPLPGSTRHLVSFTLTVFGVCFAIAALATTPLVLRVRRLARDIRGSATGGYSTIAPDQLRDELSSVTFVINETTAELRRRQTLIDDQDVAFRRLVDSAEEDAAQPLRALEGALGPLELGEATNAQPVLRLALSQVHDLTNRIENLVTAARLRTGAPADVSPIDLRDLAAGVVARVRAFAHALGVSVEANLDEAPLIVRANPALLDRAVANVVDNAIRYNRPGGRVVVGLAREGSRFRLWVTDDGPGVSDQLYRGLTAVRRFRGDENRNRRPDAPGLGLAIAREVADRAGLSFDLKRPGAGGFEAEFGGPIS